MYKMPFFDYMKCAPFIRWVVRIVKVGEPETSKSELEDKLKSKQYSVFLLTKNE